MLDGLAFLSHNKVSDGMHMLRRQVPDGLFDLIECFDATYVHGPLKTIPGTRGMIRLERTNLPKFAIDKWNVHKNLQDGHRTNNIRESWNNAFSK